MNLRLNLPWSISALFLTTALLLGMQFPRARAFTAYDCSNRSNNVEVFSLLEPASCHAASIDLRVERTLPAEIIQVKKTRMVPVFRCLAVETEVSQYCGHSSAAGVVQFFRFCETTVVDPQACRDAFSNKGLIEVGGRTYSAVIGTTSSHQEFLTGGLDDSGNCEVGQFHDTGSRKTLGYQVAQRIVEILLFNEQGLVNDVLGTVRLTDNIMAKVGDESVRDSVRGTYVWTHQRLTCQSDLPRPHEVLCQQL